MYKSPIEIINDFNNSVAKAVMDETENQVYKAVYNVGVNVDKGELLKALAYDRDQYDKGYVDGKAAAIVHAHWIEHTNVYECSKCGIVRAKGTMGIYNYCPHCGAKMDEEVEV